METGSLEDFIRDISKFGAMFAFEAKSLYGEQLFDEARAKNLIKCTDTEMGDIIYLAYKGRIMAGLTGDYKPKPQALMNAVFLRQIERMLEKKGYEVDSDDRKQSISYHENGKKILVLARQNGYTRISIRRIYRKSILKNEFSEMHVYCYNTDKIGMMKLKDVYCAPAPGKNALDPEKFKLFNVDSESFKA